MAKFEISIEKVLANEGGMVNNPLDPGGLTNYGISQRSYPNLDIKSLTRDQAIAIYKRDFWLFDGVQSQPVADKLMDAYVNMKHNAIKLVQELVGGVKVDGFWGAHTEAAVNAMDEVKFLTLFRQYLINYYVDLVIKNPKMVTFLGQWVKRARQ